VSAVVAGHSQAPSRHRNNCPLSIPFLPKMCFPLRRAKEGQALAFDAFLKADIPPGESRTNAEVLTSIYCDGRIEQEFRRGCHTSGFWLVMVLEPTVGGEP